MKNPILIALLACVFAGCVDTQNPNGVAGDLPDDTSSLVVPPSGGSGSSGGPGGAITNFTVSTYADGSPLPVTFKIDCSRLQDPSKLDCKQFIEITARESFPALRKITGVKLESRCPTLTYTIYNQSDWPYGGAGGMSLGDCTVAYLVDVLDAKYFDASFGVYDVHELLHQHQYGLPELLNDAHPFFSSTMAEAQRLIGDTYSYQQSQSQMSQAVASTVAPAVCRQAQYKVESRLYLGSSNVVYGFYQNLRPDITDTSLQVSYQLYLASGQDSAVKTQLRDAGCAVNFPR